MYTHEHTHFYRHIIIHTYTPSLRIHTYTLINSHTHTHAVVAVTVSVPSSHFLITLQLSRFHYYVPSLLLSPFLSPSLHNHRYLYLIPSPHTHTCTHTQRSDPRSRGIRCEDDLQRHLPHQEGVPTVALRGCVRSARYQNLHSTPIF